MKIEAIAQDVPPSNHTIQTDSLAVLWTTAKKDVFTKVVYPYTLNSIKYEWWNHVELIVWGPSSKLLGEDEELQEVIADLLKAGVNITACLWCSDQYGVSDKLRDMGIDVKYMGRPLTNHLKNGWKTLTF